MRSTISKIILALVVLEALLVIYFGFKAYFVIGINQSGQEIDGLGRRVLNSPWFIKLFIRQNEWPGTKWFLIDAITFWTSILVGYLLLQLNAKITEA